MNPIETIQSIILFILSVLLYNLLLSFNLLCNFKILLEYIKSSKIIDVSIHEINILICIVFLSIILIFISFGIILRNYDMIETYQNIINYVHFLLKTIKNLKEKLEIPNHVKIHYVKHVLSTDDNKCCICLTKMEEEEELFLTFCGHLYHEDCIMESKKHNSNCPICRTEVF